MNYEKILLNTTDYEDVLLVDSDLKEIQMHWNNYD